MNDKEIIEGNIKLDGIPYKFNY